MMRLSEIPQNLFGAIKVATFLILIVLFVPILIVGRRIDPGQPFKTSLFFYKCVLRVLGTKLRVFGEYSRQAPVLFVANHSSYLDVIALGAVLPAVFVAKSEVAGWPLFGFLAKIQNTVFIERRSTRAADQLTQLQDHLTHRQNLILFPEGTSSDGLAALPFKSSLFSIVEDNAANATITVQPVSITCTQLDGFPLLREERPLYAWFGDMTLLPHLWNVFKQGRFTIDIIMHPPVSGEEAANRKILATTCQRLVARGIEQSLAGRVEAPAPLLTE